MAELTSLLATIAPWIGTALGGPLGGMAVDFAAKAFNLTNKTADGLKTAISGATPEQLLALKQADQEFSLKMQELGFKQISDLESIAANDRASARDMQKTAHSLMPAALTWLVVSAFSTVMILLFIKDVPVANRDIIVYMVGQLSGFTAAAMAFWLGTTRQSEDKTKLLAASKPAN